MAEPLPPDAPQLGVPASDPNPLTPTEAAPAADGGTAPPSPPPAPRRRRRRRWPKVLGVILLLLVLLIVFAPTLAGTSPVRSFVLSKVNQNLNGRLAVDDWSVGWVGGLKVQGVRLFDAQNRQILQLSKLTTELSLIDAIRGRYHLGKVIVDGLDVLVVSDAQGNVNFAQLAKSTPEATPGQQQPAPDAQQPATQSGPTPQTPAAAEPTRLPDVRGELHLVNCSATYEDQRPDRPQTFHFPSIAGEVKVPDINQPIQNALTITSRIGQQPEGKITATGSVDAVENNIVQTERASADQKLEVQGVELAAFGFLFDKDSGIQQLSGLTNAVVAVRLQPGGDGSADVRVTSRNLAVGGPALKGDTYKTPSLSLVAPNIVLSRSAAPDDVSKWTIRAGSQGQPVALKVDEGQVTVWADLPIGAAQNVVKNLAPGAAGSVHVVANLDLGKLAEDTPNLINVRPGLTLESGRFSQALDVVLSPRKAEVRRLDVSLTGVTARDTVKNAPVTLEDIRLGLSATSHGGGSDVPDLRDLKLTIQSAFANGTIEGRSIAETNGRITADLRRARDELAKLWDVGSTRLAGTMTVDVKSEGDFLKDNKAKLTVNIAGDNLEVAGIEGMPAIREPRLRTDLSANVLGGGEERTLRGVTDLRLTATAGDEKQPTLDAELTADLTFRPDPAPVAAAPAPTAPTTAPTQVLAEKLHLVKLIVNLPQAQREFGAFVPALEAAALTFEGGTLSVTGTGSYDGETVRFDNRIALRDVSLLKTPPPPAGSDPQAPPAEPKTILAGYAAPLEVAGTYTTDAAGTSRLTLNKLNVSGSHNGGKQLLALGKSADRDIVLTLAPDGTLPSGALDLSADLKEINDLLGALSAGEEQVAAETKAGTQLVSGKLAGRVEFAPVENRQFRVASNLKVTNLTATGPGGEAVRDEQIVLVLQARPAQDFSSVQVQRLTANGRLIKLDVPEADLLLKVGEGEQARSTTTLEMVRRLRMSATLPDLAALQVLLDALSPPEPAEAAPVTAAAAERRPLPEQFVNAAPEGIDPDQVIGRRPGAVRRPARPEDDRPPRARDPEPAEPDAPLEGTAAAEAPAPPLRLGGGSAVVSLNVTREGDRTVVVPQLAGKGVNLRKGEASQTLDTAALKTNFSFVPVPPPATAPTIADAEPAADGDAAEPASPGLLEQMRDLRIPQLTATATSGRVNVANVVLTEPIAVSEPGALGRLFASFSDPAAAGAGDLPSLKTALRADGDLAELMALVKVLQGDATTDRPYAGGYTLEQRLSAERGGLVAAGSAVVNNLSVKGEEATFTEKVVRLVNDVNLDAAKSVLSIRNVSLAMEQSKALELKLAGNILDFTTERRLENVKGSLGYDWAKVWGIVEPMLSPETRKGLELRVAGTGRRDFAFSGSLPADKPFNEAVRSLAGSLGVDFAELDYQGLAIRNLDVPLTLADGTVTVAYADKPEGQNFPPPAECNGGTLNLGGARVDLTGEFNRLTIPKGTTIIENVTLNPLFSDRFGDFINNPAFISPTEAAGTVNLKVVQCDQLPLGKLPPAQARRDPGRAEFVFSMTKLQLGSPLWTQALEVIGQGEVVRSLQGEIREARVIIEKGETRQDVTITTAEQKRPLRIAGRTDFATDALDLTFTIPAAVFADEVQRYLPKGLAVPLTGTTRKWELNIQQVFSQAVGENLIPGLLGGLGKRGDDESNPETLPGEGQSPQDPVGGLLDDLINRKEDPEKEREKRERREKRRKEREARERAAPEAAPPPPGGEPPQGGSAVIGRDPKAAGKRDGKAGDRNKKRERKDRDDRR